MWTDSVLRASRWGPLPDGVVVAAALGTGRHRRAARLPLSGFGEMNSCRKSLCGCPKRGCSNEKRIGQVDHVRLGVALKVNNPDFSRLTSPIDILFHECFERWYGVLRVCRGGSSSCRGRWTPSAGTITRDGATHWQIVRSAEGLLGCPTRAATHSLPL